MDVTINNFEKTLPDIFEAVNSADFIAIDGEFTGLRNGPDITAYDTPAEYYGKLRDGSLNFLLVQVGICTFKFDELKNKYVYKVFNFYVFPRVFNKNISSDLNFLCQASSIHFLCGSGFDFNKLFKEGIPYLTLADEEILQEELTAKYENLNNSESFTKVTIPEELSSVVEDACNKIEKFLSPKSTDNEICFERCNGFIRKLIFQTAYERFSTANFSLCTKWVDNSLILVAQKGKSKAEHDRENYEKEKNDIQEAVGFSKIIKHISKSEKLIVGHNMLLDICHIVNRFCWPLPDSYWEFKEMVHQIFPRVIDTKYMCSAYPFRDLIPSSVLSHMLKRLKEPPFQFPEAEAENAECGYSMTERKSHEAGFDAYTTGLAFIALTSYLGKKSKQNSIEFKSELIKQYENRLFLMKIMDYSYINLKGNEPKPSRNHVFHITFPKEWKTSDIVQLFNAYGNIHISYCNQSTAWVTLLEQEKSKLVISGLIEPNLKETPGLRKPYTVLTWNSFHEKITAAKHNISSSLHLSNRQSLRLSKMNTTSTPKTVNDVIPTTEDCSSGEGKGKDDCIKLYSKRSGDINNTPRKRKKDDQDEDLTISNSRNSNNLSESLPEMADSLCSTSKNISSIKRSVSSDKINSLMLFKHLKGNEDSLHKTFEEASWE
ncbi:hypothetical protein PGB90_010629 [Kerria lacca]